MHHFFKKALPVAIALGFSASAVHAQDAVLSGADAIAATQAKDAAGTFFGYFRAGVGTNSGGGSQACYGLQGVPKYRFGNECDIYGEFGYTKELARAANGSSFVGTIMASTYAPYSDIGSSNHLDLAQMMVEAKNIPFMRGAIPWIGKRYYNRPDIHELDFKYLQGDGVGGGVTGISVGPGKFSYGLFRNDVDQSVAATRHSFIYDGLAVNPDGSLKLDATIIRGDSNDHNSDTRRIEDGWSFSAVHTQSKVFGGTNTLALQYGKGSGIKMGGTDIFATNDIKRTRVFDNMVFQFTPNFSSSLLGLWQRDKSDAGSTTWTSFGARPQYALHDNFKLIVDVGHDNISPADGGADQKLTKITFAPTLAMARDWWSRPELRFFVTYAKWNDAAQGAADQAIAGQRELDRLQSRNLTPGGTLSSSGPFGSNTNGTSVGLQVEAWF
jgi:maltoporin